jgi:hypothetical protein
MHGTVPQLSTTPTFGPHKFAKIPLEVENIVMIQGMYREEQVESRRNSRIFYKLKMMLVRLNQTATHCNPLAYITSFLHFMQRILFSLLI